LLGFVEIAYQDGIGKKLKKGIEISDPDAREHVYGMPYSDWKEKYQK